MKLYSKLFLVLYIICLTMEMLAVPAYPGLIDIKQPDGKTVNVFLKGDEITHWFVSTDGYTLLYDNQGVLKYATKDIKGDLVASEFIAKNAENRTSSEQNYLRNISKGLFYSPSQLSMLSSIRAARQTDQRSFPPTGNRKLVMILIGFTDLAFTKTQTEFYNLANQDAYAINGAYGSIKKWFQDVSFNQLSLTTDVKGPFTASNTMAYYGANDSYGDDLRPRELVTEAVNLANATTNFADYDNDSNGAVDGVYVIFAGYGEEAGASANAIWSHAWSIPSVTLDGKTITTYSCSPELSGTSGSAITNIGVICHEFSHVCGLPDFYDTDYAGSGGQSFDLGDWDPMASGSWNDDGRRPPFHNGYSRNAMGWQTTTILSSSTNITLPNSAQNNVSYRFNTSTINEYFMVENRQQISWDAYIPYHGMLIYHVDKNYSGWSTGKINAVPTHQGMDIEEADNTLTTDTYSGDPFPGTSSKTSFTDTTTPSSKSWANANTAKPITGITEVGGVISFAFIGGDQSNPTSFTATTISQNQINLAWTPASGYTNIMVAYSSSSTFGTPVNGTAYTVGQTISGGGTIISSGTSTSFNHTGLTAGTTYYYKAWANYSTNTYSSGITANATTMSTLPYTQNFNASTTLPTGWEIIDYSGNGQVWQIGTMTSGLGGTPGNYAYLNSDGYGSGNSQNSDLISPNFILSGAASVNLLFNHYFRSYTGSSGTLSYSTNSGSSWTTMQTWTATTTNPLATTLTVSGLSGQTYIKFKWNYVGAYAYHWCVDDIQVNTQALIYNPTVFTATATVSNQLNLTWTPASGSSNVMIAYNTTSTFGTPVNGTAYTAGNAISGGGTVLYKGSLTTFNHTGLAAGTTYYYKAFAYDESSNYTSGITTNGTTLAAPVLDVLYAQDFSGTTFPPTGWTLQSTSTNWARHTANGYGQTGTGSARANFYSIQAPNTLDLTTPVFDFSTAGGSLSFDYAYAAYGTAVDQLEILYSTNSGGSYTRLILYPGGSASPLLTGGTTTSNFVPTAAQWGTKILTLPAGTNKIMFHAISAYGNNLYLDNIKLFITSLATPVVTISRVDNDNVMLTWLPVAKANSYNVYATTNPYASWELGEWGLPVIANTANTFTPALPSGTNVKNFYKVVASTQAAVASPQNILLTK